MPYLAFNLNDGNEFVFDILEDRLSIGRDERNDIVLENRQISAFHAELVKTADGHYEVVDLKSTNGTFINGRRITGRQKIKSGDKLKFGELDAWFREKCDKDQDHHLATEAAKSSAPKATLPEITDGRRGDTQSVPTQRGHVAESPVMSGTVLMEGKQNHLHKEVGTQANHSRLTTPVHASTTEQDGNVADDSGLQIKQALKKEKSALTLEVQKLHSEKSKAEAELESLRKQIKESQGILSGFQGQHDSLKTEIELLTRERQKSEAELASLKELEAFGEKQKAAVEEVTARLRIAEEALRGLDAQKLDLTECLTNIAKNREELEEENLQLIEKGKAQDLLNRTLVERRALLEQEVREAEEQRAIATENLPRLQEQLHIAQGSLEQRRQELSQVEEKWAQAQAKTADAVQEFATLQAEMQQIHMQLAAARGELEKARVDANAERKMAEQSAAAHASSIQQLKDLQAQSVSLDILIANLTATRDERQKELLALENENQQISGKVVGYRKEAAALETRLEQLRQQAEEHEKRLDDIAASSIKLAETQEEVTAYTLKLESLQVELQRLQGETGKHEERLPGLRTEALKLQADIAERIKELASTEVRLAEAKQISRNFAITTEQLEALQLQLKEESTAKEQLLHDRSELEGELQRLSEQQEQQRNILGDLHQEIEMARSELANCAREKESAVAALASAETERRKVQSITESLQKEASNLKKRISAKTANLDKETKAKLEQIAAADYQLQELAAKISAAEKRSEELAQVENSLLTATLQLREAEQKRITEDKKAEDLIQQQEMLLREIAGFEAGSRNASATLTELIKRAKAEEARAAEAAKRLEKSMAELQATEVKRLEAEALTAKTREEERVLRKQIPALSLEMAALESDVVNLVRNRDELVQYVVRLNDSTESANKKLADLQQQISQLEEAQRVREDRVMKAQMGVDKEMVRLRNAQDEASKAQATLHDLENQVREYKQKSDAIRSQMTKAEAELSLRLDRVEKLKTEENRILLAIEEGRTEFKATATLLTDLEAKVKQHEQRLSEYTTFGGRVLSVAAALAGLETRQAETEKALREAGERDLALQLKLRAQQGVLNQESARLEQIRRERDAAEHELQLLNRDIEIQKATAEAREQAQWTRYKELEKQIAEHVAYFESLQRELAEYESQREAFSHAAAQYEHWLKTESHLRAQITELQEKHEMLRHGLPTEDATVVLFANDLLKGLDVLDTLITQCSAQDQAQVTTRLQNLRSSLVDILHQHGVTEFDIAVGTEVDEDIRRLISVIESIPGKGTPHVLETYRPGYVYSKADGHEVILRKVDVRISSQ